MKSNNVSSPNIVTNLSYLSLFSPLCKVNGTCGNRYAHTEPLNGPGTNLTEGQIQTWRLYPITHLNVSGYIYHF